MTDERALVTRAPRPLPVRLGRSLESAAPGELIVVTPRGEIYRPLPAVLRGIPAVLLIGIATLTFGLPGLASGTFAAGMYALLRLALPGYRRFREALALHAQFRHAEALAALDRISPEAIARRWRPAVRFLRARILMRLGRLAEAETALQALVDDAFDPSAIATLSLNRWLFAMHLAEVVAAQGRVAEGLAARARYAAAPDGSYFRLLRASIDLQLVLAGGDPALLRDHDLYEVAKQVLGTNLFGDVAYLLAFAFEQSNDVDMARHLFAEAPSRTPDPSWTAAAPRLAGWVADATARLAGPPDDASV